jgi:hypothetical protein
MDGEDAAATWNRPSGDLPGAALPTGTPPPAPLCRESPELASQPIEHLGAWDQLDLPSLDLTDSAFDLDLPRLFNPSLR